MLGFLPCYHSPPPPQTFSGLPITLPNTLVQSGHIGTNSFGWPKPSLCVDRVFCGVLVSPTVPAYRNLPKRSILPRTSAASVINVLPDISLHFAEAMGIVMLGGHMGAGIVLCLLQSLAVLATKSCTSKLTIALPKSAAQRRHGIISNVCYTKPHGGRGWTAIRRDGVMCSTVHGVLASEPNISPSCLEGRPISSAN